MSNTTVEISCTHLAVVIERHVNDERVEIDALRMARRDDATPPPFLLSTSSTSVDLPVPRAPYTTR
jgi:anti-sigma regulatory factor (Ser/Thr protein kinase)